MVSPIVGTTCLSKVLMDGGSGLNIFYASTLDRRGTVIETLHNPTVETNIMSEFFVETLWATYR